MSYQQQQDEPGDKPLFLILGIVGVAVTVLWIGFLAWLAKPIAVRIIHYLATL